MKVKALKSFCGRVSMAVGEVKECSNEAVLADLLRAGYVVQAEEQELHSPEETPAETVPKEIAPAEAPQKPTAKRSRKKDESK